MDAPAAERRIAHLDMDAFYASVEMLRRPELAGQPVAIGGYGDPMSRGVVSTANYEARKFGIRSAMPMRKAFGLCPHCVFLPVDFPEYRRFSRRFKEAIAALVERIEDRGIDEVYLDLTGVDGVAEERGTSLARRIKQAVREATGLTCSIGVAPNKLLAKIASDLNKPDGLTRIEYEDVPERIWPLPARTINGIGPKADERLKALGIDTIGALAAADPAWLETRFSPRYVHWMLQAARGLDERPVVVHAEPKSRSQETTFERDLHPRHDWHQIARVLASQCRDVANQLHGRGYRGRTIGVKVRFDDFRIVTRDLSVAEPTDDPVAIRRAAFECLARLPMSRRIRLLGVRVGALSRARSDGSTAATNAPQSDDAPTANIGRAGTRAAARGAGASNSAADPTLPLFD